MFLKRKITVMATVALLSTSLLAGCSSTGAGGSATAEEVLANQNARAALAMAIDKQAYCDVILNNGSIPADVYTPKKLAFDNGKDYADLIEGMGYEYNEEAAKEAWAKAKEEVGFDTVELELLTYDHDLGKRTGEYIQSELSDLEGLTVKVTNLPFEQKLERETKGEFDFSFSGWGADYPDPLTFLATMKTGAQYAKQVGYDNAEYNKLLDEAIKLPTTEAYKKYAEAEKMMLEEAYLAPIYQKASAYLLKDYVSGIVNNSWGADYTYTYADVNKPDKVLNLSTTSDIPSLDVSKSTDQQSFQTMNSTMEGLTRIDGEGKVQPGVAESWKVSEDGLTWTFNLRKNSVWSNGKPVTAKDFEYSWKRTLNPETASEYAYVMEDIAGFADVADKGVDGVGVKAVDDYTLEVKLNRPVAYFPELMSFQVFYPQNQAFVESCGEKYGTAVEYQIYNGPFVLKTWKMEDQFSMDKNPNYWDAANVKLNKINTKVVKDTGAEVNLYEDGQIDRAILSSDYVDKYKDSKELKTRESATTFMLQINGANHN
ncbi:ABC transporter substrate-binding protein [Romboutsia sp.]|uniref:ABC transporter substrate-binding protein n=1 Tax=Romboutsia sp. TaxID=1965302 RepID=UPI002C887066|nr:ABC transporter substrate-binding protein [Romboutsia sp.]HSQ90247.1 ABC transporter substrate-binding protein [Romboutsia sp.]